MCLSPGRLLGYGYVKLPGNCVRAGRTNVDRGAGPGIAMMLGSNDLAWPSRAGFGVGVFRHAAVMGTSSRTARRSTPVPHPVRRRDLGMPAGCAIAAGLDGESVTGYGVASRWISWPLR